MHHENTPTNYTIPYTHLQLPINNSFQTHLSQNVFICQIISCHANNKLQRLKLIKIQYLVFSYLINALYIFDPHHDCDCFNEIVQLTANKLFCEYHKCVTGGSYISCSSSLPLLSSPLFLPLYPVLMRATPTMKRAILQPLKIKLGFKILQHFNNRMSMMSHEAILYNNSPIVHRFANIWQKMLRQSPNHPEWNTMHVSKDRKSKIILTINYKLKLYKHKP